MRLLAIRSSWRQMYSARGNSLLSIILAFINLGAVSTSLAGDVGFVETRPAASRTNRIVYGGDRSFPPYEYLDKNDKPAGLNVDLIRAVAKARGLEVEIFLGPWAKTRAGLLNGIVDVAAMYRSPQRAREVDFAIPHELIYHEMYISKGKPSIRSVTDLAGKRVLVETDTYSADTLSELGFGKELLRVVSEPEALRALARGEGDVAVVTQTPGRPFEERQLLARDITPTGPPILLSEYAFVTRKGNRALIEQLNEGVASVKASGEYDRIYNRWIRPDRSAERARKIGWALGAALLATLLVFVWNQSLRRRVLRQTAALRHEFEEKERALAALAESEKSLRQSQKMEAIGRLAGGVAHDFNNILTVILSYASLMREELAAAGKDTIDADEILAASERAMRLTQQLLAFSRATPVTTTHLDLSVMVPAMKPMIQTLLGERIHLDIAAPAAPVIVEADKTQIEQILLNLAANARDAMPQGGRLAVSIAPLTLLAGNSWNLPAADYAVIAVSDNGVGMDEETIGRIFEPFFTTKQLGKGTGLGLATVFAHATKLGGKVTVQSTLGQGATFTVLIPLSRSPQAIPSAPASLVSASPHGAGERVLLVEDDEALRRTARIALERGGYCVIEARDGEEALELAAKNASLFMVVTDVVMPRRSGPQLVTELRRRGPDLRVLYVSGYVGEGDQVDLSAPGTAFLAKPYTTAALLETMHKLKSTEPVARS